MSKYLAIFSLSWQDEFVYRVNFILWRFRNVLGFFLAYFLWSGVFSINNQVFGYTKTEMISYIFLILITSSVVMSAPSADNIGGEIGNGNLSNYLLKPMGYLRYWFARDLASKCLNLTFSFFEIAVLYLLFRPDLQIGVIQLQPIGFLLAIIPAVLIYFFLSTASRTIAFWTPENTWGLAFLLMVLMDITSGRIFPLDVLPGILQQTLQFTPFPYLIYYPIAILLGKITGLELTRVLIQSLIWVGAMCFITRWLWQKGLKVYGCEGR